MTGGLVPIVMSLALGLFGGAAGAALITGLFNRPKIHAEAAAALSGVPAADASVAEIIQRAAGGLVKDMEQQVAELRRRVDAAERRADAGDRWRAGAEDLFEQHGAWERDVSALLRAARITPPQAPPLRPALTPPRGMQV